MSFAIRYKVDIAWIGDGLGGSQVPNSQMLRIEPTSANGVGLSLGSGDAAQWLVPVPGGNSPSAANFATAFTAMATDCAAQLGSGTALLARVQAFSSGGG